MSCYVYGKTDKGCLEINEDAIIIKKIEDYIVMIVADANGSKKGTINIGMLATNTMFDYLARIIKPDTSIIDISNNLEMGMYLCSRVLLGINAMSEEFSNVYASMTVLIVGEVSKEMVFASIGNTELQLYRRFKFNRMNVVHSESYDLLMKGELAEENFYSHPKRGILTSALGVFNEIKIDIMRGKFQENDVVFLASDGIFRHITPTQMIDIIAKREEVKDGVDLVIDECKAAGGLDNLSLICLFVN